MDKKHQETVKLMFIQVAFIFGSLLCIGLGITSAGVWNAYLIIAFTMYCLSVTWSMYASCWKGMYESLGNGSVAQR